MVQRLGRGVADRFHRTAQIGQGITDRNQLAALTLHGFYSPMMAGQDLQATASSPRKSRRGPLGCIIPKMKRPIRCGIVILALLAVLLGIPVAAAQTVDEAVAAYGRGDYATAAPPWSAPRNSPMFPIVVSELTSRQRRPTPTVSDTPMVASKRPSAPR